MRFCCAQFTASWQDRLLRGRKSMAAQPAPSRTHTRWLGKECGGFAPVEFIDFLHEREIFVVGDDGEMALFGADGDQHVADEALFFVVAPSGTFAGFGFFRGSTGGA